MSGVRLDALEGGRQRMVLVTVCRRVYVLRSLLPLLLRLATAVDPVGVAILQRLWSVGSMGLVRLVLWGEMTVAWGLGKIRRGVCTPMLIGLEVLARILGILCLGSLAEIPCLFLHLERQLKNGKLHQTLPSAALFRNFPFL
jgi:hypothetical protein